MNKAANKPDQSAPDNRELERLLSQLASGDTSALEPLYQATRAAVYGLALSMVRQHQDAEDITHDTYVAVYRAASGYEARGKPLAWIFTITKNLSLMKLRSRNRTVSLEESDPATLAADKPTLSIEDKLVLRAYLEELTDDEQMLVVLHAAAGWKHREVAAFMAMPVQHAIVKYNRAIRKLAKKLRQNENTDKKSNIFRILVIF